MSIEFEPVNDLERALVAAQNGQLPFDGFAERLLASKVFVLLDRGLAPGGELDVDALPMVLTSQAGNRVLAIFTAAERSSDWPMRYPRFSYGLLVEFSWLLRGVAPGVGIVLNPGSQAGFEMPASGVQQLKEHAHGT